MLACVGDGKCAPRARGSEVNRCIARLGQLVGSLVLRPLVYHVLFATRFTSGRVWYHIRLAIRTASGSFQYSLLLDVKIGSEF